jgi:hypothetical protein
MKKQINYILAFASCFLIIIAISTTSPNNIIKQNTTVDSFNRSNQEYHNDSIFITDTSISFKNYSLKVLSTIQNDRVESTDSNFFNPVVLKQQLQFLQNGKIIKEIEYPTNKVLLKVTGGNYVKMLENVLFNIGVVEGSKGSLYVLNGYGGCNSCTEYIGFFSLEGEILWYSYANTQTVFGAFGDLNKVLEKYNIPKEIVFSNKKYKNVDVYKNNLILSE